MAPTLRDRLSDFAGEFAELVDAAMRQRCEMARRETLDEINQYVRRLRQAADEVEVYATLADACASFSTCAATLRVEQDEIHGRSVRGVEAEEFGAVHFAAADAAAFATALETKDPVVALHTATEISSALADALGGDESERVCVAPVLVKGAVAGFVCAAGVMQVAPIELLAQVAGLTLEARIEPPVPEPATLISIQPAAGVSKEHKTLPSWDDLSNDARQAHLRAQRFARLKVAELLLYHPNEVNAGREAGNVYGALRGDIDRIRGLFDAEFMRSAEAMVDYVHLELVHTLGHEDAAKLGAEYPGPLV